MFSCFKYRQNKLIDREYMIILQRQFISRELLKVGLYDNYMIQQLHINS